MRHPARRYRAGTPWFPRPEVAVGRDHPHKDTTMSIFLKSICLAIYVLAMVGPLAPLPWGATPIVQWIAVALLGAHALELLVGFKGIKRHPGPLVDSIALTLLFGFLHWKPLLAPRSAPTPANATAN
jgi:hypothetical protein